MGTSAVQAALQHRKRKCSCDLAAQAGTRSAGIVLLTTSLQAFMTHLNILHGHTSNTLPCVLLTVCRWGADWLMAARYSADGFVAVTWMPGRDVRASHRFWGHPEDLAQPAGVAAVTAGIPASDLLSAGAAALAATSVVFKAADPAYSQQCLQVAQDLYNQAIDSEGLYSKSVPAVQGYYDSYSTLDDLTLAAAWLALRTGDRSILQQAQEYYQRHIDEEGGGEMRR